MNSAKIVNVADPGAIKEGAQVIIRGGLVAFPTETVYGLGADACNPEAVARIFEVKRRPSFDPIIVHIADPESAITYGEIQSGKAAELAARFWPGPLTLVVPKSSAVPPIVTAGLGTVALRVPAHPAALALIRASGRAIAAPSANLFGRVSPTDARHVAEQLGNGGVDLILDGGACVVGIESTIVSLAEEPPLILRAGGIPIEQIEQVLGPARRFTGNLERPLAPGQLERHYATRTPLRIAAEDDPEVPAGRGVGLLSLGPPAHPEKYAAVEILSASSNLREAAAHFFAALHSLDSLGLDAIIASPFPERDLGVAIMDRLRRCAAR